ncbi:MAG TPA: PAS domain S-box protein [Burkholderiales bacterium]|nr:PAS domain S-box protein [Burkholderiales bacterium]
MPDVRQKTAGAARALHEMLRASDGILEFMPIATFICDADGVILQYNQRSVEIWGREPLPGQTHADFTKGARFWNASGEPVERTLLSEVLTTGNPARDVERVIERADGVRRAIAFNIAPLSDDHGALIGAVHCMQDITERKGALDALAASRLYALEQEQRLAATYEHVAIGITEIAPDGRLLRVNEGTCSILGYSREELLSGHMFRYTHPDDVDPDREAFRKQVAGELEFYSAEKRFVRKDGRVIWISVRSSSVRDDTGRLLYVVRVLQDITERKAAERRQKLLIDELNHRVKNTLATVQSLASQTARSAPTPEAFQQGFEGRLIALSKAHDQLTMHHWENADLREVLTAGLAPYGAGSEHVVLRGEDVLLRPRAVLTLAMAFHELITNAAKYGALSVERGRVAIHWRPVRDDMGRTFLRIEWREEGGPPAVPPERRGFGSRLIENSIAAELGGSARLIFAREGLRCEMQVPQETTVVDFRAAPGEDLPD